MDRFIRLKFLNVVLSIIFILNQLPLEGLVFADSANVAPTVRIVSPSNNFTTNLTSLDVAIYFRATANPNKNTATGNVQTLLLKLDGTTVVTYNNPPQIKEDTTSFTIDISQLQEGAHILQAFAYQGNINAGLEGSSDPITFIIERGPPPPPAPQFGFIHGYVFDAKTSLPLKDVVVTLTDIDTTTLTDGDGKFSLAVQGTGEFGLTFEKEGYVFAQRKASVVSTRDAAVDPVYLTPIDPQVTIITDEGGTHINSTGKIVITIPPNSLPAGTESIAVQATLYDHSRELPQPLPEPSFFTYALDLKPDGINFTQPVLGKIANELQFWSGTKIPIGYYNAQTLKWEDTGLNGVVSADGRWVEFEITHFTPYDINLSRSGPPQDMPPPGKDKTQPPDDDKKKNCAKDTTKSLISLKSGELQLEHNLPSVKILNQEHNLAFIYNSLDANPIRLVSLDINNDPTLTAIPSTTTFKLNIEGKIIQKTFKGVDGEGRFSYLYDCTNARGEKLSTGSYPYTIEISNDYTNMFYATADFFGGPPIRSIPIPTREPVNLINTVKGRLVVNNLQDSSFGSGWSLSGLQRLHFDPDGAIVITEGDGSAKTFKKQLMPIQDLVIISWATSTISVLLGLENAAFEDPVDYPVSIGSFNFGDFNQDTFVDLVMVSIYAHDSNNLLIFPGNGDGTFQQPAKYFVPGGWWTEPNVVAVGDFNRDGFQDLVVAAWYGGNIFVYLGNGDGTFQNPVPYLVGYGIMSIAVGDFNQDTFSDLVISNDEKHCLSVLLGRGDGTFQEPVNYPVGPFPKKVEIGNFNTDSFQDLVTVDWFERNVVTLLGNGDGTFSNPAAYPLESQYISSLVIGDFNRDTFSDLAVVNPGSGLTGIGISILLSNGDGTFQKHITYPTAGYTPRDLGVGDFNQDTFSDLVVTDSSYNNFSILFGNGDGTFRTPVAYPAGVRPVGVGVIDLDATLYPEGAFVPPKGEYSYILQNPDKTYTRYFKDGTKIIFNEQGLQTQIIDKNSNATNYIYSDRNADGKQDELFSITLPTGAQYQLAYDARGKLYSITDAAGRVTKFDIDSQGNLTKITNPDNTSKIYTYDTTHLVVTKTDERGFTTEYLYDNYGALKETRSPEREVTEISADGTVTTSRKNEAHLYYPSNIKGLINDLPENVGTPQNPADVVRPESVKEELIDGKGNAWVYSTDRFGGRLKFTDPLNNTTTYKRDIHSNLTKLTRANGSEVQMAYDGKGNLLSIKENYNLAETKITYEPSFNQPTSIKDAEGNLTTIDYDLNGNPIQITDAQGTLTKLEYSPRGQVTKIIQAFGASIQNETNFTYDPVSFNLLNIIDPLGNPTVFTYDTAGNIKTITDAEGKTTTYNYDAMNRLTSVIDADNKITTYTYNQAGNLITVTDAKNQTTTFDYDEQNQLTTTTNPLNQQRRFSYDVNRNLSLIVTPNGDTIKLYNNPANLLEKKFLPSDLVNYSYDSLYNLTDTSDSDSSLSFVYDPISRLIEAKTNAGFLQPQTSISYTYDKNNNRTSVIVTPSVGEGEAISYIYDSLNRLTDIKDQQDNILSHFEYDALSRRITKTLPNNITTTYTYDLKSQLLSIGTVPERGLSLNYSYDNVGNRTTLTDAQGLHNYSYDNLYHLTSALHPNIPQESYSYDPVGNRLGSVVDVANRLLDDGTYTYNYDNNGNLIKKTDKITGEITTYSYDAEDRLIEGTVPARGLSLKYAYDPLGRRIQKSVNGTITKYIYDNEDIILEYDTNNNIQASYTHGPGIDEPLILDKSNTKYYYHTDALGSVTSITDETGNIVQSYTYDSFGNIVNESGSLTQPYTYTGREYDPETNLYYYRARYYDARVGRFLQEDPIFDVNLYAYVNNNPLNRTDPKGLQNLPLSFWILEAVLAVIVATIAYKLYKEAMAVGNALSPGEGITISTTIFFDSNSITVSLTIWKDCMGKVHISPPAISLIPLIV